MKPYICRVLGVLICGAQFLVLGAATPTNMPPQVRIVYPYEGGGLYALGAAVKIIAEAADLEGPIAKVEFYADNQLLGTITNSPYDFRWFHWDWGIGEKYQFWLTARAYDAEGLYADSARVLVFFVQAPYPPQVVLDQPKDGTIFSTQTKVPMVAKMSHGDDQFGEVEFILGTNVVATSSDPPYECLLGPFPPGEYRFQARGRIPVGDPWSLSSVATVRVLNIRLGQPALSNGLFQCQIEGMPTNQSYGVQASTNTLQWNLISTNSASGSVDQFSETLTNNLPTRFYRVVAPPTN